MLDGFKVQLNSLRLSHRHQITQRHPVFAVMLESYLQMARCLRNPVKHTHWGTQSCGSSLSPNSSRTAEKLPFSIIFPSPHARNPSFPTLSSPKSFEN